MPLTEQEKEGLRQQLQLLLEADEPEAALASLRRIAERRAHAVTRGAISDNEARRYQALAAALQCVEDELDRAHAHQLAQPRHANAPQTERPQPTEASQLEQEFGRRGPPDAPTAT
jgi:hypothetical protein